MILSGKLYINKCYETYYKNSSKTINIFSSFYNVIGDIIENNKTPLEVISTMIKPNMTLDQIYFFYKVIDFFRFNAYSLAQAFTDDQNILKVLLKLSKDIRVKEIPKIFPPLKNIWRQPYYIKSGVLIEPNTPNIINLSYLTLDPRKINYDMYVDKFKLKEIMKTMFNELVIKIDGKLSIDQVNAIEYINNIIKQLKLKDIIDTNKLDEILKTPLNKLFIKNEKDTFSFISYCKEACLDDRTYVYVNVDNLDPYFRKADYLNSNLIVNTEMYIFLLENLNKAVNIVSYINSRNVIEDGNREILHNILSILNFKNDQDEIKFLIDNKEKFIQSNHIKLKYVLSFYDMYLMLNMTIDVFQSYLSYPLVKVYNLTSKDVRMIVSF